MPDNTPKWTPLEELALSVRAYNCLKNANIRTVEELRKMTDAQLLRIENLGRITLNQIKALLAEEPMRP